MIYFLMPTRGRPELLKQSIRSLRENCSDLDADTFRVAVAVDPDDSQTLEAVHWSRDHDPKFILWETTERFGYRHLYRYYNGLCEQLDIKDDDLLVLWNDDATMITRDWDEALLRSDPDALVLDLQHNLSPQFVCFPAMRGVLYNALGHYTRETPHVDSYIQDVARQLGKVRPINVYVQHDRPDLVDGTPDSTFREGRAGLAHAHYFSQPFQDIISQDVEMVKEKLCL